MVMKPLVVVLGGHNLIRSDPIDQIRGLAHSAGLYVERCRGGLQLLDTEDEAEVCPRNPDAATTVTHGSHERFADPPDGKGGELVAARWIELFDGSDQSQIAGLQKFTHLQLEPPDR